MAPPRFSDRLGSGDGRTLGRPVSGKVRVRYGAGSAPGRIPRRNRPATGSEPRAEPPPVDSGDPVPFAAKGQPMLSAQPLQLFCLSDSVYYDSPDRLADEASRYA